MFLSFSYLLFFVMTAIIPGLSWERKRGGDSLFFEETPHSFPLLAMTTKP